MFWSIGLVFSLLSKNSISERNVPHVILLFLVSIDEYVCLETPIISLSSSCDSPIFARKTGSSSDSISINLSLSTSATPTSSYAILFVILIPRHIENAHCGGLHYHMLIILHFVQWIFNTIHIYFSFFITFMILVVTIAQWQKTSSNKKSQRVYLPGLYRS